MGGADVKWRGPVSVREVHSESRSAEAEMHDLAYGLTQEALCRIGLLRARAPGGNPSVRVSRRPPQVNSVGAATEQRES
jgi:hypothetical protein